MRCTGQSREQASFAFELESLSKRIWTLRREKANEFVGFTALTHAIVIATWQTQYELWADTVADIQEGLMDPRMMVNTDSQTSHDDPNVITRQQRTNASLNPSSQRQSMQSQRPRLPSTLSNNLDDRLVQDFPPEMSIGSQLPDPNDTNTAPFRDSVLDANLGVASSSEAPQRTGGAPNAYPGNGRQRPVQPPGPSTTGRGSANVRQPPTQRKSPGELRPQTAGRGSQGSRPSTGPRTQQGRGTAQQPLRPSSQPQVFQAGDEF